MINRPPRLLSQRNYNLLQEIRQNAARLKQIDAGLSYRRVAVERDHEGAERPLHIGPQIDLDPIRGKAA